MGRVKARIRADSESRSGATRRPTGSALFRIECETRSVSGHATNANRNPDPDFIRVEIAGTIARGTGIGRAGNSSFPVELFVGTRCARPQKRPGRLSLSISLFGGQLARLRNFRFGLIQFRRSFDSLADASSVRCARVLSLPHRPSRDAYYFAVDRSVSKKCRLPSQSSIKDGISM